MHHLRLLPGRRPALPFRSSAWLALTIGGFLSATPPLDAHAREAGATSRVPQAITIRPDASDLESLAAGELQRYVYLRTGTLLPITPHANTGHRLVVTRSDADTTGAIGRGLKPQQFTLATRAENEATTWWIVGGDDVGTLYGAYRFAEKLGVRFGLDDDVVPDAPWTGDWPQPNETGRPRFALRGLQPFHDFAVGPDWWNLDDYRGVLSQMAKLRLNFIGFCISPSL